MPKQVAMMASPTYMRSLTKPLRTHGSSSALGSSTQGEQGRCSREEAEEGDEDGEDDDGEVDDVDLRTRCKGAREDVSLLLEVVRALGDNGRTSVTTLKSS